MAYFKFKMGENMAGYVQISHSEVQEILSLYGVSDLTEVTPAGLGISNSNYKIVTSRDPLLLKICNDKNENELKKELEILLFLNRAGLPYVLTPYSTLKGEWIYHYKKYFGVIFPFIKGSAPLINNQNCHTLGKALGELHSVSLSHQLPPNIRRHGEVADDVPAINHYVNHHPQCPTDFKEIFLHLFPQGIEKYLKKEFPVGIIHGDFYYDNGLFEGERINTMLDFEQGGVGHFIFDLGVAISGTCLKGGEICSDLLKSYLQGYESVRPLTPLEKDSLAENIYLGLFSIALWRIRRFLIGHLDPKRRESYKELILRALNYHQQIHGNI